MSDEIANETILLILDTVAIANQSGSAVPSITKPPGWTGELTQIFFNSDTNELGFCNETTGGGVQNIVSYTGSDGGVNPAISYEPWNLNIGNSEFDIDSDGGGQEILFSQFIAPSSGKYTHMMVFSTDNTDNNYDGILGCAIYDNVAGSTGTPGIPSTWPLAYGTKQLVSGNKDNQYQDISFVSGVNLIKDNLYWAAVAATTVSSGHLSLTKYTPYQPARNIILQGGSFDGTTFTNPGSLNSADRAFWFYIYDPSSNFIVGPKGNKGPTGPTGDDGSEGPQGVPGIQGPTGYTGYTGFTNVSGVSPQAAYFDSGASIASTSTMEIGTNQVLFAAGSSANPGISFQASTNTGFKSGSYLIAVHDGHPVLCINSSHIGTHPGINIFTVGGNPLPLIRQSAADLAYSWEDGYFGNSTAITFTPSDWCLLDYEAVSWFTTVPPAMISDYNATQPFGTQTSQNRDIFASKMIPKGFQIDATSTIVIYTYGGSFTNKTLRVTSQDLSGNNRFEHLADPSYDTNSTVNITTNTATGDGETMICLWFDVGAATTHTRSITGAKITMHRI